MCRGYLKWHRYTRYHFEMVQRRHDPHKENLERKRKSFFSKIFWTHVQILNPVWVWNIYSKNLAPPPYNIPMLSGVVILEHIPKIDLRCAHSPPNSLFFEREGRHAVLLIQSRGKNKILPLSHFPLCFTTWEPALKSAQLKLLWAIRHMWAP